MFNKILSISNNIREFKPTLAQSYCCQAQSSFSFSFAEQTELALFSTNPADTKAAQPVTHRLRNNLPPPFWTKI